LGYLHGSPTPGKKLLNDWSSARTKRLNDISEAINKFSTYATLYAENYNKWVKADKDELNFKEERTRTEAAIKTQKDLVDKFNKEKLDAGKQSAAAVKEQATTQALQVKSKSDIDASTVQIESNQLLIDQLSGKDKTFTTTKDNYSKLKTDELANLQAYLNWMKTEIVEESDNIDKALASLQAGNLKECLAVLSAIVLIE